MYYDNFADALSEFRLSGGAMCFASATSDDAASWEVTHAEELTECFMDPRAATENALREGGMTDEQVTAELADWQD